MPRGNFGGGWRRFIECLDNLVGRQFWRNRIDSRRVKQNMSGFHKTQFLQGNFKGSPKGKFNFRSKQDEFPHNPNKLVGDFIERRKDERHFRSWKCVALVWRSNAYSLWESIKYGIQNFLRRKVEMSHLHNDRAILWCINALEKVALERGLYHPICSDNGQTHFLEPGFARL